MNSGLQGQHWLLLFVSFSNFIPNRIKGKNTVNYTVIDVCEKYEDK